jgi:hypothetical protein
LEPYYHLVYIEANINSLKDRDPKGLYNAADQGEIKDLVGYSDINPYEKPSDASKDFFRYQLINLRGREIDPSVLEKNFISSSVFDRLK